VSRKYALLLVLLSLGLAGGLFRSRVLQVQARTANVSSGAVAPFLYPPYPGRAVQSSIFDHSNPDYSEWDRKIVVYSGDIAYKDCPKPPPPGIPPPAGVCEDGYGGYWSYSLGDWVYYNGHDGIDYAMSYRPLFAAADASRVAYAGWQNAQNHREGLGLYVRLTHPNGYSTVYGHMSAISVQTCAVSPCPAIARGEIIGYSGNSGNSTGPHLHFTVRNPQDKVIDPYGWEEKKEPIPGFTIHRTRSG
jgi:murein DD-endopeptidase MepM/ murein hydrolase activator NlpD